MFLLFFLTYFVQIIFMNQLIHKISPIKNYKQDKLFDLYNKISPKNNAQHDHRPHHPIHRHTDKMFRKLNYKSF